MNLLGILLLVAALLISVMLHEAGHFLTARAFGMKATQFFVGFGPTLFSRRRGETEYGVKAIPAGGFVKIIGMTPLEDVAPVDQKRAFFRQPTPQRVVVLAAGSTVHLVIALLLSVGVAFFTPIAAPGAVIGSTGGCVLINIPSSEQDIVEQQKSCPVDNSVPSPAAAAGLQQGDVVTAVNGHTLDSSDIPADYIRKSKTDTAVVTFRRGTVTQTVTVPLVSVKRDLDTGGAGNGAAHAIGISFSGEPTGYVSPTYSQGTHQAGQYLGLNNRSVIFGAFYAIKSVGHSAGQLFNKDRADNPGAQLTSVVGVAQISGDIFAAPGIPFSVKAGDFLLIIAALNASLGILNLLPLLPFDGGHIAVTLAERLFRPRRRAAAAASAVPQEEVGSRISRYYTRGAPIMYAFSAVIIVFSLVVLVADVKNPVA